MLVVDRGCTSREGEGGGRVVAEEGRVGWELVIFLLPLPLLLTFFN